MTYAVFWPTTKGNVTCKKCTYLWQPLPCWLNEKRVYFKSLEEPPLFIPQADSYWPSTWPSLMREFLNIRGCLTHILALNQPSCSHLYHQGLAAVTYCRERWHILLPLWSPGRRTSIQGAASVVSLRNAPPRNLKPPQFGCSREFLNYETMPFWPRRNFLSRSYAVPTLPGILLSQPMFPWMGMTPEEAVIDSEQSGTRN